MRRKRWWSGMQRNVSGMHFVRLVRENDLRIATILATTLPFVGYEILSDWGRRHAVMGCAPAIAVTDLPPWAVMVVKEPFGIMSKVDAPCREYFASRSACSLLEVRTPSSELRTLHLPFNFLQEGIHGTFALRPLGRRG